MLDFLLVIVGIVIFFSTAKKSSQASGKNVHKERQNPVNESTPSFNHRVFSAGDRPTAAAKHSPKGNSMPDPSAAEYSGAGISFKYIPEGKDELELLIRHNHAHEKELERQLQSRDT